MTVPVADRKAGPYTGNGVATSFAFAFKTFVKGDLRVVRTVIATDVDTDLVLDSDYSVTLNGNQEVSPGGSITYPLVGSPMASTHKLTVVSNMEIKQPLDITNLGGFLPQTQEDAFDRAVMLIGQLEVDIERSIKMSVSSTQTPEDFVADLLADAAAAEAAAAAAAVSASGASTSASTATTQATNAATSAATAQTLVDSIGFRDVLFKTFADSPITITQAMSGKLLSIDTTGGSVVVTMPQISTLVLPYTVGVKKTTGDGNTVTLNRSGTDTFDDGSTSLVFSVTGGAALIPDTDSAPDKWSVASFGPVSGVQMKQQFVAGVGFTAGVSTTVTLTETPIASAEDAITVYQDGVYQQESEWSYAPGTGVITFGSVIGASVAKIEAVWVAPLAIGTLPFLQVGTGAVVRTSQEKMRDIFSAADFGFLTTATAAANKTAMVAAIAAIIAVGGGDIFIPRGVYACNPDIELDADLVGIRGAGPGQTYGEVVGGTEIDFGAGTNGFVLDFIDGAGAGSYCRIMDISLDGQGNIAKGIYIEGQVTVDNVQVSGCTAAGIHIGDLANTTHLHKVTCVGNTGGTGYGLLVDGVSNTSIMVEKCVFRQNTVGMRIENALHCEFNGCIIESNTNEGLYIYKPTGGNLGWLTFNSCWFETNNVGTSNYQIVITAQTLNLTTGPANFITFNQPMINGTGTVRHMHIEGCIGFTINEPVLNGGDATNSIVLSTNAYHGVIIDKTNGGVVNNGTLCYERSNEDTDFGIGGGLTLPNVFVNGVKFPAVQVPASNANTLDDYEEGTFTSGIADNSLSPSGEGQVYTIQVGTYVKIGVRVWYDLTVRTSDIGTLADETVRVMTLPFTAKTLTNYVAPGACTNGVGLAITAGTCIVADARSNNNYLTLQMWSATTGVGNMFIQTHWTADGGISASGSYDATP